MVETQLGELQSYTLKNWQIQKNVKMGDLSGIISNRRSLAKAVNAKYFRAKPCKKGLQRSK